MRGRRFYRILAIVCLAIALLMTALAAAAGLLGQTLSAAAAGLCAVVLVVPGVLFLNQAYRLHLRQTAQSHVGMLVEDRGVVDMGALGKDLNVSAEDADRILRRAVREGHVQGDFDKTSRFVAASARRCPICHAPQPSGTSGTACVECGANLSRR